MQKSAKTEQGKYSSKFALSELLVCGECGTPYKRCTWARNGKKRIVWRCISRLEFGRQYCHDSPTLDEDNLHAAILAAINQACHAGQEVDDTTREIAARVYSAGKRGGASKQSGASLLELQERLAAITARQSALLEVILEDMDNPALNAQLKVLAEDKQALQAQIETAQAEQRQQESEASRMAELEDFLEGHPGRFIEFNDIIVRKMFDKVTVVDKATILIHFRDQGGDVIQSLP